MTDRKAVGRRSKNKGKRGELELAHKLGEFGYECRRTAQYNGKELGSKADVIGLPGIHIECKRVERLSIYAAIEQAVNEHDPSELPAVFHRMDKKPWLVTMTLEDWMQLFNEYVRKND